MKIKIIAAAALCIVLSLLTGCSSSAFDNSDLMRPPRATGDRAEIQAVIEKAAGGDYTLKYPQKGSKRSAIIMEDVDGTGSDEALALYKANSDTSSSIHLLIIKEIDGVWTEIGNYSTQSSEVDRVCITDLDGDGNKEVLVGWVTYNQTINTLAGYKIDGESSSELTVNGMYTDMAVGDFTGNGLDDVILLNLATAETSATASLLEFDNDKNELAQKSSVIMDNNITSFANVSIGKADETHTALFVDGIALANNLSTQVIYYSGGLKNPLLADQTKNPQSQNPTARTTTTVCKDINGDGLIEVPTVTLMNGEDGETVEKISNVICWNRFSPSDAKLDSVMYTVPNYSDGYYFILPESWENKVTARIDTSKRQLTFYEWVVEQVTEDDEIVEKGSLGSPLLTIQVFTEKDWSERKNTAGYTEMKNGSGLVYAVHIPETESSLAIKLSDVSDNLRLIKE